MAAEVSCGDEIAEYGWLHERGMTAGDGKRGGEAICQVGREHEISQAEGREENFAEAAGEEDFAVAVEALQGGEGAAGVAKLGVEIVFKTQGAGFACPFDQLQAAGGAHGGFQRGL